MKIVLFEESRDRKGETQRRVVAIDGTIACQRCQHKASLNALGVALAHHVTERSPILGYVVSARVDDVDRAIEAVRIQANR